MHHDDKYRHHVFMVNLCERCKIDEYPNCEPCETKVNVIIRLAHSVEVEIDA